MTVHITYYENKTGRLEDGTIKNEIIKNVKAYEYITSNERAYIIDELGNCRKIDSVECVSIEA